MDDLINRQDAIGLEYIVKNINGVDYVMLSEVQMMLRKMPPAQKIGHWIELETWLGRGVICSECGKLALHQVWSDGSGEIECEYAKSNYCPSCGIKMEVENDGRHN